MGTVKISSDASMLNGKGTWAAAIRDYEGKVLHAAKGKNLYACIVLPVPFKL